MVKVRILMLALLAIAYAANGHAALTTYTDRALFIAALPGAENTLNFDSLAAGTTIASGTAVGGITFNYDFGVFPGTSVDVSMAVTDGNQFGGGGPFGTSSSPNFLGTDDLDLLQDGDDFSLAFASANAIGMSFISADVPDATLFDDDIQLTAGGATASLDVSAVQQTLTDGLVFFLGIIDTSNTFTSADITTYNCPGCFLFNVDDITTSVATSVVPIPGALWLFMSGILGLFALRRKSV